jgi:hypothetical protein
MQAIEFISVVLTDHLVITPNIDHVHIFFQYEEGVPASSGLV